MPKKNVAVVKAVTGKKRETRVRKALKLAREIVAGNVKGTTWIRGDWLQTRPDPDGVFESLACFCAEGAVRAAARGVVFCQEDGTYEWANLGESYTERIEAEEVEELAIGELACEIPKRSYALDVIQWNDAPSRKRSDVVALFDRAIARLEQKDVAA